MAAHTRQIAEAMLSYAVRQRDACATGTPAYKEWTLVIAEWQRRLLILEVNNGPPGSIPQESRS